jgi:hypothetical protein
MIGNKDAMKKDARVDIAVVRPTPMSATPGGNASVARKKMNQGLAHAYRRVVGRRTGFKVGSKFGRF